jgi:hypothetical protein
VVFILARNYHRWSVLWRENQRERVRESPVARVLIPYILLGTSLIITHVPVVSHWLQTYGVLVYAPVLLHFALLASPGMCLLIAAIIPFGLFALPSDLFRLTLINTWRQSLPSLVAIVGFLCVAALMQKSGMTGALGAATATIGRNYVWITALVGGISGWLTSSTFGGDALGASMQMETSMHVGLPLSWIMATQNVSAAMASIISPARMILVLTAAGAMGQEGVLLRKVGPVVLWSILLMTCLLIWFLSKIWLSLAILLLLVNVPLVLMFRSKELHDEKLETDQQVAQFPLSHTLPNKESWIEDGGLSATTNGIVVGRHSRTILTYLSGASPHGLDVHALQQSTGLSYAQLQHLLHALQRNGYVVLTEYRRYLVHPAHRSSVALLWCP